MTEDEYWSRLETRLDHEPGGVHGDGAALGAAHDRRGQHDRGGRRQRVADPPSWGIGSLISGIGVFYPDGSPTQQVGIVPDLEIRPTIEGIRAGRDEVLEEAVSAALGREFRLERGLPSGR